MQPEETFEPSADGVGQPALGAALRELRRRRGDTLGEVAQATGISTSFLSLVEKGRSDISLGRLMRLLKLYGVRLGELIPEAEPPEDRVVVRRGEARHLDALAEGVDLYLLAPDTNRLMMPLLGVHQPGSRVVDLPPHPGEAFVHVLEGTVLMEREGKPPLVLHEGDSAYIPRSEPLSGTTLSERPARVLSVITPPTL
jgi:transcriptional regulator with XRE-family HTH domain